MANNLELLNKKKMSKSEKKNNEKDYQSMNSEKDLTKEKNKNNYLTNLLNLKKKEDNENYKEKKGQDEELKSKKLFYFPKRFILLVLLFFGMTIINAQRVNIGVTVVAILHKSAPSKVSKPETLSEISNLDWNTTMVGWLHSIFYIGIFISQIPCGYLVTKWPSHRCLGWCIFLSCFMNLFLPVSITKAGYVVTCLIRLVQGLIEGMLYPSTYDILRIWSLPEEKSRMGATVLTGSYIGPTLGMVLSGILTHYCGWVHVFYAHATLGIAWFIFWLFFAYESPSKHPTIHSMELNLIHTRQEEIHAVLKETSVPWKSILFSLPVYSLVFCNFARSSVFYMLLTNQPTYLHIFNFTFVENGLFSALPHAFMALFCILSGPFADLLLSKPALSTTFVRKLCTSVGFGIEALFFFGLALVFDKIFAVVFLTIAVGVSGIAISGWQINHLDLAPKYAGILVAITMTFGTLAGVVNPIIVASLTEDQTLRSWHKVFWMTGGILLFATIFFCIFGSGERQSWAVPLPPRVRVVTKEELEENNSDSNNEKKKEINTNLPYGTFEVQPQPEN